VQDIYIEMYEHESIALAIVAIDVPNMTLFDIKILPCFTFIIAACKFQHHCAIVGSIVAGDVANLQAA
jgi:hypothetical protein